MVGLDTLVYAGSHGFDITGPGGLHLQHEEAIQRLPALDAAEQTLRARLAHIAGALVERKRFAIAVHYRLAVDQDVGTVTGTVAEVHRQHASLRQQDGKMIVELQPDVAWDKGRAVLWLRETLGVARPEVVTLYIGDDTTDEDAFRALAEHGLGLGIIVAASVSATRARYSLRTCDEVQQFLSVLLEMLQRQRH